MMERARPPGHPNIVDGKQLEHAACRPASSTGSIRRNDAELTTVVQNTVELAPVGPQTSLAHRAGKDGKLDLLPFEQEMVDIVNKFIALERQRRARRADEAVPEDLHRQRL